MPLRIRQRSGRCTRPSSSSHRGVHGDRLKLLTQAPTSTRGPLQVDQIHIPYVCCVSSSVRAGAVLRWGGMAWRCGPEQIFHRAPQKPIRNFCTSINAQASMMDALVQPAVTFDLPRSRLRPSASGSFSVTQSHTKRTQLHSLTPPTELHSPSWCASDLAKRLVKLDLSKPIRPPPGGLAHAPPLAPFPTHTPARQSACRLCPGASPRHPAGLVDLGPSIGLRGGCRMHMTTSLQLDGGSCNPDHG